MKKTLASLAVVFIFSLLIALPVLAVDKPNVNEILPSKDFLLQHTSRNTTGDPKVDLPSGDLKTDFVPRAIQVLLGLTGTIAFITFTVAGVMLVTAHENEEQVTKAKQLVVYAVVGLIVVAVSYAVIYGVLKLFITSA